MGTTRASRLLIAIALLAPLGDSVALDPRLAVTQYQRESWQLEAGLPQNTINTIAQTADGYLWVGTQEGFARFDGLRFVVYDRRGRVDARPGEGGGRAALPESRVSALLEDRLGGLLVGATGGGLARLRDGRLTPVGPSDFPVSAFCRDSDGTVWVGGSAGVRRVERDGLSGKVSGRATRTLYADPLGGVLAGEADGLRRLTDGQRLLADVLPPGRVTALHRARSGDLWVGTDAGLAQTRGDRVVRVYGTGDGLMSGAINALLEDRDGNLWVGSDGGLTRLGGEGLSSLDGERGLTVHRVTSLLEDREGSLWVGTDGGGLTRLKNPLLVPVGRPEGFPDDIVRAVVLDRHGALWLGGSQKGAGRLWQGRVTPFTAEDGLSSSRIREMLEDSRGDVWFGTWGAGLSRLVGGWGGRLVRYGKADGLGDDTVCGLFQEPGGGRVLVATPVALHVFDEAARTFHPIPAVAPNAKGFARGAGGRLWVAASDGLYRFDGPIDGAFHRYTAAEGLAREVSECVYEDAQGSVFVGTRSGGLHVLQGSPPAVTAVYTTRDGLLDDTTFQIQEGAAGELWMSCNKGLSRVRKADLVAHQTPLAVRVFGRADGMRSPECNSGFSASTRTPDGRLWFSTVRGAVWVDPGEPPRAAPAMPVLVEELTVDGVSVPGPFSPGLTLAPGSRDIEIRYTALALADPERVRFQYRLEGYDRAWVLAGARRTAYYTNVAPGSYRFQVRAVDVEGAAFDATAPLGFTLAPRFTQTPAFAALVALALAGAAALATQLRLRGLRRRERELSALVDERTRSLIVARERAEDAVRAKSLFLASMSHELRTPLNAVLGFAQLMDRDRSLKKDHRRNLGIILSSGEHLLGLINDVLSLSRVEAGRLELQEETFDLGSLAAGLIEMLRARAEAKGLELRLVTEGPLPRAVRGDAGKLRQILLNLAGNAVKFTSEGAVTLTSSWSAGRARFEVRDTGPGIAAAELAGLFQPFFQTESGRQAKEGTGLGLAISRGFARQMRGDVTVVSQPGKGTTFTVEVSLPAADEAVPHDRPARVLRLRQGEGAVPVLVADGQPEDRLLLVELLRATGFLVREAGDDQAALELLEGFAPRLGLLDARLPGRGGPATVAAIRALEARRGGGRASILALTADVGLKEDEARAAGCDGLVGKPLREETLFQKIGELLDVRFEYEDAQPDVESSSARRVVTRQRLESLPADLRGRLVAALDAGDQEGARVAAAGVDDPELANAILVLVEAYRFDELERLLSPAPDSPSAVG